MTRTAARRALRRPSAVILAAFVVAVLAAAVLSACTPLVPDPQRTPSGLAEPDSVAPLAPLVIPAVLNYCPLVDAVHDDSYPLPTDEVYICRADGRHDTDGVSSYGPWESASRIDHPAALLTAYRVPDAVKDRGFCAPSRYPRDPLIIWVHRRGATAAYYAPVDGCGNPTNAAAAAYQAAKRILLIDIDRGAPGAGPSTTGRSTTGPSKKDGSG